MDMCGSNPSCSKANCTFISRFILSWILLPSDFEFPQECIHLFFFCNDMHVRNTAIKKMYFYGCVYVSMSAFSMQFIYPILSMKHFPFEHVILLYYLHLITMSWFWHSIYHFLIKNLKHIRAVCIDIYTFEF